MMALWGLRAQTISVVGYALLIPETGKASPVGTALFTYSNASGVLVSQAGVAATTPIRSGRLVVDESLTRTAVALVNPSSASASITLILRDAAGTELKRQSLVLSPRQHLARYIREIFPDVPPGFAGSLTFESNQPLAALTLGEGRNGYGEALYTTLPVVDMSVPPSTANVTFPQIAVGDGYTTQLLLINRSDQNARGHIRLTASDGRPLLARLSGSTVSEVAYEIAPQGIFKAELEGVSGLGTGYAVVTPVAGSTAPGGAAAFRYQRSGQLISAAGVLAAPSTTSARIFVDQAGTRTGIAIANPGTQRVTATLRLMDRQGNEEADATRILEPGTHLAAFADELFTGIGDGFTGVMQISTNAPVAPVTLKITTSSRGDPVLTTLPVADLTQPLTGASMVFPQIAIGSGFSTRFIMLNADTARNSTGALSFFTEQGTAWTLPMSGLSASGFPFDVAAGGGRQYLPGNTAQPSSIQVIDPSTNRPTTEITINEGNTVRPRLRLIDDAGMMRDDFDISLTSVDPDIAVAGSGGSIYGKRAGFATVALASGRFVQNATATVVHLESGSSGLSVTGIAQDPARRLYLAATDDHTVLLAQTLRSIPDVYAGTARAPGLKNDLRLQSQFRRPAFLTLNHADGSLYVSDSANHLIRRVRAGPNGRVETLTGTGLTGARDGTLQDASFNDPQGIALDDRGGLWVADSGNHTIRRIDLATGTVRTVAGAAGSPGSVDGTGAGARFRSPAGIAVEPEPAVEQEARQRRGEPSPPVKVLVADTGNGVLRRVRETGEVETIALGQTVYPIQAGSGQQALQWRASAAVTADATSPAGVAIDAFGTIYFSEPNAGSVRAILRTGDLVSVAQANSFRVPRGLAVDPSGKLVVADAGAATAEVRFGSPEITSITPNQIPSTGGGTVTISGTSFAPDSFVVAGNVWIRDARIVNSRTIVFTAPPLWSGGTTVTVQNRGGIAQKKLLVEPIPLSALPPGYVTTLAGGTFVGDGSFATAAILLQPYQPFVTPSGDLLITEGSQHRIRRVSSNGLITTIAGTGVPGFSGDDGPAIAAPLVLPFGVAMDAKGDVLVADSGNARIRRISAGTGIITTIAGGGTLAGSAGDNRPATSASITVRAILTDARGNIVFTDYGNHRIRRIDHATGIITTIAGTGEASMTGDGGPATQASVNSPWSLAFDSSGDLYISDFGRVRRIDAATGIITSVSAAITSAAGLAFDPEGNLYFAELDLNRVRKLDRFGAITTFVGTGGSGFTGDNGPASQATLSRPQGVAFDAAGNCFISDAGNGRIRRIDAITGIITTIAGGNITPEDGTPAWAAHIGIPYGLDIDSDRRLYVADNGNHSIRRVDLATGIISTLKGVTTGVMRLSVDHIVVSADYPGRLYFGEGGQVRQVDLSTNVATTIAGTGQLGVGGDGGLATRALFAIISGVTVAQNGDVYIADSLVNRVRKVDVRTGIVTNFAGTGASGFSGDGGLAVNAQLDSPRSLALDGQGNLYIADADNNRIRRVDSRGVITTVATNVQRAQGGINYSWDFTLEGQENLLIAGLNHITRVNLRTGATLMIAGNRASSQADGIPAAMSAFAPHGIAVDAEGNIYYSEGSPFPRVRVIRAPASP